MNILDIIDKKVQKKALTNDEIHFFIQSYSNGEIADYQSSALLMAIVLNGMTKQETKALTYEMMHSGEIIDLSKIKGMKVDKHSTGGVGDKTTLVLGPLVAAMNIKVAKMSGRGLGFTGGTIDKLESINGFSVNLTRQQFINNVNKINIAIMAQSNNITPADKKLYALRDVTGTVASIPLIASSIMSKKLATGTDAILLDVKCGNGAFMKNQKQAEELARELIQIGKGFKKDVRALITNMTQPLGRAIGNRLEVLEAIETLKGNGEKYFHDLVVRCAVTMSMQAKIYNDSKIAKKAVLETLNSGKALKKFDEFIANQGGDLKHLYSKSFWNPKYKLEITAEKMGYVHIISALEFGILAMEMGAGRLQKTDMIDFDAGIYINAKTGEAVKKDDVIFTLYSNKPIAKEKIAKIKKAYKITKSKSAIKIILKEMK